MTGVIDADFLDELDDEDLISTDRQELDWDADQIQPLLKWGDKFARKVLMEWANRKKKATKKKVYDDENLKKRIEALDKPSQKQIVKFLGVLGQGDPDQDRVLELADSLIQAYEFQQFHDVLQDLDDASEDPDQFVELLGHLRAWQVLESRAILEIIKGRLKVVDVLDRLVMEDAPETAPKKGTANLHDLIAEYPWLLNPDWQVLFEERSISTTLRDWYQNETGEEVDLTRFDFLALAGDAMYVVVEIKRPGHAVELEELQRLARYAGKLHGARGKNVRMALVYGGNLNVSGAEEESWRGREDVDLVLWSELVTRGRNHYGHYRGVLERNLEHPSFAKKTRELARTRVLVERGDAAVYRGERRKDGIGVQEVEYAEAEDDAGEE